MENEVTEQLLDWVRNRYFGKYRGVVEKNTDDTNRGRLLVTVPAVLEDLKVWAMPCVPYAGDGVGFYSLPKPETGVWIEFEGGDPSYPIWTGCFWGDNERPKNEKGTAAVPSLKIMRSEKGLMVTLDDSGQVITLSDDNGSNLLKIKVQQGQITVKGARKVVVEAPQIELVENAMHPVVFGDNLLQYLNQLCAVYLSHTHPGELALGVLPVTPAPPVPPLPPATSQLCSTKVKSG